jgi:tetratricopeptide (TPR) repeat protein
MHETLKCPVCPRENLNPELTVCPNCGTDLMPLQRLHGIPRQCFNHALTAHAQGDLHTALGHAACAVSLDKDFTPGRILLGKLLWHLGQREAAVTHWRAVLERDPENQQAHDLLAGVQTQKKPQRRAQVRKRAMALVAGLLIASATLSTLVALSRHRHSTKARLAVQVDMTGRLAEQFGAYREAHPWTATQIQELQTELARLKHELAAYERQAARDTLLRLNQFFTTENTEK